MITHQLIQGTPEWHAHRAKYRNASDAPAMLCESPYETRTELLTRIKTGIAPEVSKMQQKIYDDGHRYEAMARPLAEKFMGEELSPIVGTLEKYSASFDGIDFGGDSLFEHKGLGERLASLDWTENAEDFLPEDYMIQMEQQLMVSGGQRCLFMASKWTDDNQLIEERHCWYVPNQLRRKRIIDGWAYFEKDLENFVPPEVQAAPDTKPAETLPVPSIVVKGEVSLSNLAEILPQFDRVLETTNTELVTDDHFAQADIDAKASRTAAKNLKLTAQAVIDQIAPVSEVVRTLENYAGKFDALGLKLEKAVKSQKDLLKSNAILKARRDFDSHVEALESEIKPIRLLTLPLVDFSGAISGVKTINSMNERINNALLTAKMEADETASDIRRKLAWCKEHAAGKHQLFPDLQQIIVKQMDDFTLLIKSRIADAEKQEQERIQAEAQRIADEAERKRIEEAARAQQESQQPAAPQPAPILDPSAPAIAARPQTNQVAMADTGLRIKLGDINAVLGFTVSADFLASIGWPAVAKDKNAMLYREADFPEICASLVDHIVAVSSSYEFKKAA